MSHSAQGPASGIQAFSLVTDSPATKAFMPPPNSPQQAQLSSALEKTGAIQDTVARSAQELALIKRVLDKAIPPAARTAEMAAALAKTAQLEDHIRSMATELAHVNELLRQEVAERAELAQQLRAAGNALGHDERRRAAAGRP